MQNKLLSPKVLLPTSLLAAVFVAVMRIVEYKSYYQADTGLLKGSYVFTIIALAVTAVITAVLAVSALKDKEEFKLDCEKNLISGVTGVVSAVIMVYSSVWIFLRWFGYKTGMIYSSIGTESSFMLLLAIFSILTAVFLFAYSLVGFGKKSVFEKAQYFGLFPTFWGLVFLLYLFTNDSTYIVKSENYYILLGAVAILSSILSFVRAFVFKDTGKRAKLTRACLPCSIILSLGFSFSEIYFSLTGFERLKSMPIGVSLIYLAMGIFGLGALSRTKAQD